MNDKVRLALFLLIGSAAAMIWGASYRSDHPFALVGALFGATDATYELAGWALGIGILVFLVGVGVLIAGLSQPSGNTSSSGSGGAPDDYYL